MSGEQYKPLPANHSDFAILLASFATERAFANERLQEAARIVDGLEGPLLRSFVLGCAEQIGEDTEAGHRAIRALRALASESGAAFEPPTKRDVEVTRRKPVHQSDAISGTIATGVAYLLASEPFGPLWSKVAAGGLALAGWIVGRLTPVKPKTP